MRIIGTSTRAHLCNGLLATLLGSASFMAVVTASALTLFSPTAFGQTCPADIQNQTLTCNTNRISIAQVGLVPGPTPNCVAGTPVNLDLAVQMQTNSTASNFDVSVWVATDGLDISDPNGASSCVFKGIAAGLFGDPPNGATAVTADLDGDSCPDTNSGISGIVFSDTFGSVSVNCDPVVGGAEIEAVVGWKVNGSVACDGSAADLSNFNSSQCGLNQNVTVDLDVIGNLRVCKLANPATASLFNFTSTGGFVPGGLLTDNGVQIGNAGAFQLDGLGEACIDMEAFLGDPISVTETQDVAGFGLAAISCIVTDGVGGGFLGFANVSGTNPTVNVTLAGDQPFVECLFTNSQNPFLTLVKTVTNDHGGTAVETDFQASVDGGNEDWGQQLQVAPGVHSVAETGLAGYTSGTWGGDCSGAAGSGTTVNLVAGQSYVCTITNDDIAPELTVIKTVVNDHGGLAVASDFTMTVNGTDVVSSPFPGAAGPTGTTVTLDAGQYSVQESMGSFAGQYASSFSADCSGTIGIGETATCTVTNDDIAPQLTVIKVVTNDDNGTAVASEFTINITGTDVSPNDFAAELTPGTLVTLDAGSYSVGETLNQWDGKYEDTFSADCSGTFLPGDTATCTVTNDDIAPTLLLVKNVINDGIGDLVASDFDLTLVGTDGTHNNPGVVYNDPDGNGIAAVIQATVEYTVSESPVPQNYVLEGIVCTAGAGDLGTTFTPDLGEDITCTFTNNDINDATFHVTKDFIPDDPREVEVFISCNDGLPIKSDQVTKEDSNGITFVVELFTPGNLDCEITEDPIPSGYDASYGVDNTDGIAGSMTGGASCLFEEVVGGGFECVITNTAKDATFEVSKVWEIIGNAGDLIPQKAKIIIQCNNEFTGGTAPDDSWSSNDNFFRKYRLTGSDTITAVVDSSDELAVCGASEIFIFDDAVESEHDCGPREIGPGGTSSCTITNTVFFEGIPTLSQYGLAILALLMLGIGAVGFRRFG